MENKYGFGWRPQLPDHRDEAFAFKNTLADTATPVTALPVSAMAKWNAATVQPATFFPVFDQADINSCTGNSTATMMGLATGLPARSRLELYYEGRKAIGETNQDNGCYIRDVIKALATLGAGSETLWTYTKAHVTKAPPLAEMAEAKLHVPVSYHALRTGTEFRQCLVSGFAFVIGITCYDGIMSDQTANYGILPLPLRSEQVQGGHAVCVIGYDDNFAASAWATMAVKAGFPAAQVPAKVYIIRNSWGVNWGNKGSFAIDAKYLENPNLGSDAWTIRMK